MYGPATQGLINLNFIYIPSAAPLTIREYNNNNNNLYLYRVAH